MKTFSNLRFSRVLSAVVPLGALSGLALAGAQSTDELVPAFPPASGRTASAAPGVGSPQALIATCLPAIKDQSGPGCIQASSVPTLGKLLPLSSLFSVMPWGYVGIGTSTPTSRLDVEQDFYGITHRSPNYGTDVTTYCSPSGGWIGTLANVPLHFFTNDSFEQMTLAPGGRLGINNWAPTTRLDVGGRVLIDEDLFGLGQGGLLTLDADGSREGYVGPMGGDDYVVGVHSNTGNFIDGGIYHSAASDITTVFGDVKSFRVENPEDPSTDFVYACVEGPEAAMYLRGTAQLVNGRVQIELPRHFALMAAEEGITVQLTPLSPASYGLCVVQKSPQAFTVQELMNGLGNYSIDWEVKAVRKSFEGWNPVQPKLRSFEIAVGGHVQEAPPKKSQR